MYPPDRCHVRIRSAQNGACLGVVKHAPNVYEVECIFSPNSPFATFILHRVDANTVSFENVEFPTRWLCVENGIVSPFGSGGDNCIFQLQIMHDGMFELSPRGRFDEVLAIGADNNVFVVQTEELPAKAATFEFVAGKQ